MSDFIGSLDAPLGIPKPNTLALVSFDLPIAKGDKIHCLDVLHSLTKYTLGFVDDGSEDFSRVSRLSRRSKDIEYIPRFEPPDPEFPFPVISSATIFGTSININQAIYYIYSTGNVLSSRSIILAWFSYNVVYESKICSCYVESLPDSNPFSLLHDPLFTDGKYWLAEAESESPA